MARLAQARPVPDDEELDLAAGPALIQPALERDFLAYVVFQLIDIDGVVVAHAFSSLALGFL